MSAVEALAIVAISILTTVSIGAFIMAGSLRKSA